MKHRWTKQEFINHSILTHGNTYDYSKSVYTNYHTKLEIICSIHGSFWQLPQNHIAGRGCKKCGGHTVFNTADFISSSIKIHGDKYDYSKSIYTTNNKSLNITCKIHGKFSQTANSHLRGSGCPKCGNLRSTEMQKHTNVDFIKKSIFIHGDKYKYTNIDYKNIHTKVSIICPKHGQFFQSPHNHVINKQGCPICFVTISKPELEFLEYLKIPNTKENRQKRIGRYRVDGIDIQSNTVYEFLGDYYHGNPMVYCPKKYNHTCKQTFGSLYSKTLSKLNSLKTSGYNVKYIWENDWNKFKNKKSNYLNVQSI